MKIFKKTKRDYPAFWKKYLEGFGNGRSDDINEVRFAVLDTETTGLDVNRDRMLSIGVLALQGDKINVRDSLEVYIKQEQYNKASAPIHGIIKNERVPCCSEEEALKRLLDFIGNSVLVAHHAKFDINMINKALKRQRLPALKNKVLDTGVLYKKTLINSPLLDRKESYSLDLLADKFDIPIKDRHTALGDAYITAIAFIHIINRLREKGKVGLKDLLEN